MLPPLRIATVWGVDRPSSIAAYASEPAPSATTLTSIARRATVLRNVVSGTTTQSCTSEPSRSAVSELRP